MFRNVSIACNHLWVESMYMAYTIYPNMPEIRRQAVELVKVKKWSTRKVARHFSYSQAAIVQWCKKDVWLGLRPIPTLSSRPHNHPNALDASIVRLIVEKRLERRRCADLIHRELVREGVRVSFSSVHRTLERHGLINKRSPWKRRHDATPRPEPERPGMLVEIDTIHDGLHNDRLYIYTMLDVCTRHAWAGVSERINTHRSIAFVKRSRQDSPFLFQTLQSDHGPEFSTYFTEHVQKLGMVHRHSRVRQPNDNAHLERFNRTIQEECLDRVPRSLKLYREELKEYLHYYNTGRIHMGIGYQTPQEVITRC